MGCHVSMFFIVNILAKIGGMLMKIAVVMSVAMSVVVLNVSPSSAQQRTCKAALDYCLKNFVRPGTNDPAGCQAAYAQAMKTGQWPAHAATNSSGFPCRNK